MKTQVFSHQKVSKTSKVKTTSELSDQDLTDLVAEAHDYAVMVCCDVNDNIDETSDDVRDEMVNFIVDEIKCTEECAHDIINHYS